MRWSPFKEIKLGKQNDLKTQKTAHKDLFCSLQSNPAPAIVYRQRVDCFEVTAGSCRSQLLHGECTDSKICVQKENKTMQLKMKNGKKKL